jgi:RNA polymerase sigma-70 factor (ECF subfamily)
MSSATRAGLTGMTTMQVDPGRPALTLDAEFLEVTGPYRRELLAHCYRMSGSVHDAEDLVQETYLRAWRAYHGFEGRSSLRTWLYRIATNVCLSALDSRGRRPMPTGLGAPSAAPEDPLVERGEVPWLQPVPDAKVGLDSSDPQSIVATRASVRLALVAALQHLPARQRAVLVLREVLAMPAAEVAAVLDTTVAAVNSSLQRARAQLDRVAPTEDDIVEPTDPRQRELLDRYARALEAKDVAAIVRAFTADAVWEMPPFTAWYQGAETIGRLIGTHCPAGQGELLLLPTRANGQPAFATYLRRDGQWHAFQLQVLTPTRRGIAHVAAFFDLSLFASFGLPMTLASAADARVPAARGA